MTDRHIQDRSDPRELAAYSSAEAAHYLDIPVSTVRYWSLGRDQIQPLLESAQVHPLILSFVNLVELHVLSAIRRKHRISMPMVHKALDYVQGELNLTRPLANRRFRTDGVDLFVEQ